MAVLVIGTTAHAQQPEGFQLRPLVGASPQEVGQYALGYARKLAHIASGPPQVAVARSVTLAEFERLGLLAINLPYDEPPLTLMVLQGSFDFRDLNPRPIPGVTYQPSRYVAYVFDVKAGAPTLIVPSRLGGKLRVILGDPTLAEDAVVSTQTGQSRTNPTPGPVHPPPGVTPATRKLEYGQVAPTVTPPGTR